MRSYVTSLVFTGILLFCCIIGFGQPPVPQPPSIVPPSPNAFAFAKYGNIPISPYNGLPNISLPVYEISYRDIKVPVTISYHASGIKVGDEASRIGLGWVLNAGGVISRSVINGDDLSTNPNSYLSNNAPAIPMGPTSPPTFTFQNAYTYQYYATVGGTISGINLLDYQATDFEPDQFSYNFGGYSGKFVLSKSGRPILEKQSKIRIVLSASRDTWEVTTSDGFIYKFLDSEYFVDYNNTAGAPQKSAWYLSEIISPAGASVKFYYKVQVDQFLAPVGSYYERKAASAFTCSGMQNCRPSEQTATPVSPKKYSNIALDSIGWNTGRLIFNYDPSPREDIDGDKKLTSVQIIKKKNSSPSEEVVFVQDYFTSTSAGPLSPFEFTTVSQAKALKRLKLTGIIRRPLPYSATNQEEKHFFEYYEDKLFPPKNSYARDHWGYYNGKLTNTSLLPSYAALNVADPNPQQAIGVMGTEKDPSAEHMQLLSLKSIIYPTKGKTTFYYEPHDFEYTQETMGGDQTEPEVYTEVTPFIYSSSNSGNIVSTNFDVTAEYEDQNHKTVPVTFQGAFRTNITTPCSAITGSLDVWFGLFNASNIEVIHVTPNGVRCNTLGETGCVYCPTDANNPDYPSPVFTYKATITLAPGIYQWRAFIASGETRIQDISAQFTWTVDATKKPQSMLEPDGSIKKYKLAGGLRIKKIEDWEPDGGSVSNVRTYDYHYKTDVNSDNIKESHSYGRRMVKPAYSFYEISWQQVYDHVSQPQNCYQCASVIRDSGHPQANYSGAAVGYDQVVESFGLAKENGSITYEYENSADQILPTVYPYGPVVSVQPPAVNSQPNPGNGNLLRQSYFTASGVKQRMVENHYNRKYNQIVYGLNQRKIPADADLAGANPSIHLMIIYPAVNSNFPFQSDSHTVEYSASGVETNHTVTEFSYDNQEHLQLTRNTSVESNGHKTLTDYKYPADYSVSESNATVTAMKNKFMHSLPLQVTVLDEVGGTRQIKSRDFTMYETLSGGLILPTQKYAMQSATLKAESTAGYIPATPFDTTLYKAVYAIAYNSSGNINKMQNKLDFPTAYLWGHKESFPIAQIKNAVPTQCFYTSFEEDGDLFTDASVNAAKTGLRVKTSSSYVFPSSYTPVAAVTVMSYWYYQGGQWIYSGVVPYQSTITTSGTKIDEVRAYPKWAAMTTYTYIPEVGMSSTTDPTGQTTSYEYDEMSRLKIVRDKDRRIVKSNIYVLKK